MTAPLVVSLSGGKDSTAMLLMMLERGESIHSVVYFDAGEWEFPQMHEHIAKLEEYVGMKFVRLAPKRPFVDFMLNKEVRARGQKDGPVKFLGWGWPSPLRRWCTREKSDTIDKWTKENVGEYVSCIGFADDEQRRAESANIRGKKMPTRFPLIEYGVTEKDALAYCFQHKFTWGGLYKHFDRVSCFCCPLQSLKELRKLRRHFPELWAKMLRWEEAMNRPWEHRRFHHESSVRDLDARFCEEDRQLKLPGCAA